MRLPYVSKGIGVQAEPEEGETPTDLITNVIIDNDTRPDTRPKTLFICLVTRRELLRLMEERDISPYTGEVERISKEYEVMIRIFEEKYELSKVLSSKEETERVIQERNERKVVLSIITSLKTIFSSSWSLSSIFTHNPRLLPRENRS